MKPVHAGLGLGTDVSFALTVAQSVGVPPSVRDTPAADRAKGAYDSP